MNRTSQIIGLLAALSMVAPTASWACGDYPIPLMYPDEDYSTVIGSGGSFYDGGSYDPDNGQNPGDGIEEYRWKVSPPGGGDYEEEGQYVYVEFGQVGTWLIRLAVLDDDDFWSWDSPNPEERYASCSVQVNSGAPSGSKSVQFTINTNGVDPPDGTWDDPARGGATRMDRDTLDPDRVVVYNSISDGWEWQVTVVCDVFCGPRPGIVDISSGDDSDLTASNYCTIVNAMVNYAGVANISGTYYGCLDFVQAHEDVHLQQLVTELGNQAAAMLNMEIMGPYPVDVNNPDLASAEGFYDAYEWGVWNEAINRCRAADSTVASSWDYENDAVEALRPFNTALAHEICQAAAKKQPPWPSCQYCP